MILISFACERVVDNIKLPEFKQKLVITSFISPCDTVSYFNVASNKKIYGELNTEESPGNLTGHLSNGTSEVALDTIKYGFILNRKKMPIEYGKKYRLTVSSENGLSSEAYCTVPHERKFNIKVDTFSVINQYPGPVTFTYRSLEFALTINDFAGEENFYRISGKITDFYRDPLTGMSYINSIDLGFEEEFFTDKGMDGKEIVRTTNIRSNELYYMRDSAFLEVALLNTEKSYYLYHKSLENYYDAENPFSEVSPLYSNIKGGLGVFTSYAVDSLNYRIK